MSVIMDNRLEIDDKHEEVKKLQELVKKLELQNEELRSERQNLLLKTENSLENIEKEKAESETTNEPKGDETKSRPNSIDSFPPNFNLKLGTGDDDQCSSDDETWLVDSPKAKSHSDDWLRKDVDDLSLVIIKKSLVKKLDEIANSPHHSPRHSLYSPSSSSGVLSPESPPSSRGEIDTRTFVRPRKKRTLLFEGFNDENRNTLRNKESNGVGHYVGSRNGSSREGLSRSNGSLGSEEEDRLSSASDGSYTSYRLVDVEDVNNVARLQEESLKHPEPRTLSRMSSGVASGTRGTSPMIGAISARSLPSSGGSAASSQEDLLTPPSSNPSNVRRYNNPPRSALQQPRRYNVGHSASRENSDMSTPPDSPYNSQQNLESSNGRTIGSRLPSLNRRLGGSDSRMLDRQGSPNNSRTASPLPDRPRDAQEAPRAPPRVSRLQTPQTRPSRLTAPSPVRVPMASLMSEFSADPDEMRPKATSGIIRPVSRLQPPRSRLSQSPAAKPSSHSSDWREGCY